MASWADTRPIVTYQIRWNDGDIEAIQCQGINYHDSGHIQFWRNNQMILSVRAADVRQVRLMSPVEGVVRE